MMQIAFVYFVGCPHAAAARTRLRSVLQELGLPEAWTEWDSEDAGTPAPLRGYASPSVLIDGVDVDGKEPTSGSGCAVGGGPTEAALRQALQRATR
jgi:hypothetical protein